MSRALRVSSLGLWLLAPCLAFLSFYRPFITSVGRAVRVPARLAGFELVEETPLTPRELALLGTDDAVSRTYRDAAGGKVFLVVVFHQHNWKSVHPPHLCLRGSDMVIESDGLAGVLHLDGGRAVGSGRIVARSRTYQRRYLSLFAYGAAALCTGSYSEFVWYHLPRAVVRRSAPGFLVRVEAWLDDGDAEARCRAFAQAILPPLLELLDD